MLWEPPLGRLRGAESGLVAQERPERLYPQLFMGRRGEPEQLAERSGVVIRFFTRLMRMAPRFLMLQEARDTTDGTDAAECDGTAMPDVERS
jgi:hypothetical protein